MLGNNIQFLPYFCKFVVFSYRLKSNLTIVAAETKSVLKKMQKMNAKAF
jgi:hypothetical protein